MIDEQTELATEIVDRWVNSHKKSMTTLLILVALSSRPMWAGEIRSWLDQVAGWSLTERGLHRVLQRMNKLGLVAYSRTESPKSGADRKVYEVTDFGLSIVRDIKASGLAYLKEPKFNQLYDKL